MFVIHIGGQPPDQVSLLSLHPTSRHLSSAFLFFILSPSHFHSPSPHLCFFSVFSFPSWPVILLSASRGSSSLSFHMQPLATLFASHPLFPVCLFTSISLSTLHCFSPHLLIASDNKGSEFHRNPALKKHSFKTILNDPVMTMVCRVVPLSNL